MKNIKTVIRRLNAPKELFYPKAIELYCNMLFKYLTIGTVFTIMACADLQTVGRRTILSPVSADSGQHGIAIHLDAQQRLVLVDEDGDYCAEPSPDALAAYASSLGLGVSVPSQGAASVAQALQSTAGSIGLRTQTIQLMRDALYRICEARANGSLQPLNAAMLLARSQDLTAVVVAVEQLTGAVVANQVALNPNASASASANLVANQQLLDQAREDEASKRESLAEAMALRDQQQQRVTDQQAKITEAERLHNEATDPNSGVLEDEVRRRTNAMNAERDKLPAELEKLNVANTEVERRQDLLTESIRVRQAIEDAKNAALTQAMASTGSSAQFSSSSQRNVLSADATKEIAGVVERLVSQVLSKNYTEETCTSLLTYQPPPATSADELASIRITRQFCLTFLSEQIRSQTEAISSALLASPVSRSLQARRESAARYIRTLNQSELDIVAGMLGVGTGSEALVGILLEISGAQSDQLFNTIAEKLSLSCQSATDCNF